MLFLWIRILAMDLELFHRKQTHGKMEFFVCVMVKLKKGNMCVQN